MIKKLYGIAIDDADYKTRIRVELPRNPDGSRRGSKTIWTCPIWSRWRHALTRTIWDNFKEKHPTYKECTICDEWLRFSNFKAWMETQDWEGKFLDKDIIVKGNKHYSPETCAFVTRKTNNIVLDSATIRGEWPIGVTFQSKNTNRPFLARAKQLNGKQVTLGYFITPEEAHLAWKAEKHRLACILSEEETDPRVKQALLTWFLD